MQLTNMINIDEFFSARFANELDAADCVQSDYGCYIYFQIENEIKPDSNFQSLKDMVIFHFLQIEAIGTVSVRLTSCFSRVTLNLAPYLFPEGSFCGTFLFLMSLSMVFEELLCLEL